MFQLYDSTRRRITLALFFLMGLLPTAGLLAWGLVWQSPWYVRYEEERLGWQLGLTVLLDDVRHPRPGEMIYEGVQLANPETGKTLFRCQTIEMVYDAIEEKGPALTVTAWQPEIEVARLDEVATLVERVLARRTGWAESRMAFSSARVTLQGPSPQTLLDMEGKLEPHPTGVLSELSFRVSGVAMSKPIRLRIARNRQVQPPATGFDLDTGDAPLPCSALALGADAARWLGPKSKFCGTVWANYSPEGWNGELVGQFTGIDLQKLVSDQFPHRLTGTAQVVVHSARFSQGRLLELAGYIEGGPGVIGRSLVDAAVASVALIDAPKNRQGNERGPTSDRLEAFEYNRLSLAFRLDNRGLLLGGTPERNGWATVLDSHAAWLLVKPDVTPMPLCALLQMLVPGAELQVPASRQTGWLLHCLPVAEATSLRTAAEPPSPNRVQKKSTGDD